MNAWVRGDGEAVTALFSAGGTFDGAIESSTMSALHDWYRALGRKYQHEGCELTTKAGTPVSCAYTFEEDLTRALLEGPVNGAILLYIEEGRIARARNRFAVDSYYEIGQVFKEWVDVSHPRYIRYMYRSFASPYPLLSRSSILLWERYIDEFGATPEWALYNVAASAVCRTTSVGLFAAIEDLGDPQTLEESASWYLTEARIAEEGLEALRMIPGPPNAFRAGVDEAHSIIEHDVDRVHQIAEAVLAGDRVRVDTLRSQRFRRTLLESEQPGWLWNCLVGSPP